jgi:hypothetical protein
VKKAWLRWFPNPEHTPLENGELEVHCYLKNDSEPVCNYTVTCMETQTTKQLFEIASLHTKHKGTIFTLKFVAVKYLLLSCWKK